MNLSRNKKGRQRLTQWSRLQMSMRPSSSPFVNLSGTGSDTSTQTPGTDEKE